MKQQQKAAAIPDEADALIQSHDRPYISYQEIPLTKAFDVYLSGILRSETDYQLLINNYLRLIEECSLQLLPLRAHKTT